MSGDSLQDVQIDASVSWPVLAHTPKPVHTALAIICRA
jgi:hypothetical protein